MPSDSNPQYHPVNSVSVPIGTYMDEEKLTLKADGVTQDVIQFVMDFTPSAAIAIGLDYADACLFTLDAVGYVTADVNLSFLISTREEVEVDDREIPVGPLLGIPCV